jgi:hypothetical protein
MVVSLMVFEGVSDEVGGMSVGSGTGGRRLDLYVSIELWEREWMWVEGGLGHWVRIMVLCGLELVLSGEQIRLVFISWMLHVCFFIGQMMLSVNNAAINENKVGFMWMQVGHMMGRVHVVV